MVSHVRVLRHAIHFSVMLSAGIAASGVAAAQGSQSGRTTQQFEAREAERARAKGATPVPQLGAARTVGKTTPLFFLKAVRVTGVTVVPGEEIAGTYRRFLGKSVSQADLLKLSDDLTELYRRRGYALSRAFVPIQDVKDGRLHVRIVEGYIKEIVLRGEGTQGYGARRLLHPLTAERPVRLVTLERRLLLVNDTPGLRIKDTALEEIGQATGRFRLIVELEASRIALHVDLDNRGTPDIGPLQSFVTTAVNSALVQGDVWALNVSTIPDSPRESACQKCTCNAWSTMPTTPPMRPA